MKILATFLFLVFTTLALFSQEWERDVQIEEDLYDFNIDVEAWFWDDYEIFVYEFEDYESENWSEIRYNLSSILMFLELKGMSYGLETDDLEGINIIYAWEDWEMVMDSIWLENFYEARRSDRTDFVERLVRTLEVQWESDEAYYFKGDLGQYENEIVEQEQQKEQLQMILPQPELLFEPIPQEDFGPQPPPSQKRR